MLMESNLEIKRGDSVLHNNWWKKCLSILSETEEVVLFCKTCDKTTHFRFRKSPSQPTNQQQEHLALSTTSNYIYDSVLNGRGDFFQSHDVCVHLFPYYRNFSKQF